MRKIESRMIDSHEFRVAIKPVSELHNLASVCGRWSVTEDKADGNTLSNVTQHPDLHDEKLIVCEQSGHPVCFAHVGTGMWADEACGYLRALGLSDVHRVMVHAVMDLAESNFRKRRIRQVRAGAPDYTYGSCVEDGSIALLLLLQRGYKIVYGNVNYWMDGLGNGSRETPQDPHLSIESAPEAGNGQLPNSYIRLRRSGRKIGEAWCFSAWHYGPSEHTQQVFHVGDIDIVDEEQGKGFGRYFLGEVIFEMRKLGYTKVSLSTGVGNLRARLLYTSMGFQQGKTEHILMKDLLEDQELGVSGVPIYGYPQRLT